MKKIVLIFSLLTVIFYSQAILSLPKVFSKTQTYSEFKESNLLLVYTKIIPMIEDRDNTPLLRIYNDGKVHIHYPSYMKNSGDYFLTLSPEELSQLMSETESSSIISFQAKNLQKDLEQVQKQTAEIAYISDETVFYLQYKSLADSKSDIEKSIKTFRISNINHLHALNPNTQSIKTLKSIETKLKNLLNKSIQTK